MDGERKQTPDESAAEKIGRAIGGRIPANESSLTAVNATAKVKP